MVTMSMDQSLFGDDEPVAPEPEPTAAPIRDWQIDLIRNALDARGLVSMDERQALIEDVAGRPVDFIASDDPRRGHGGHQQVGGQRTGSARTSYVAVGQP